MYWIYDNLSKGFRSFESASNLLCFVELMGHEREDLRATEFGNMIHFPVFPLSFLFFLFFLCFLIFFFSFISFFFFFSFFSFFSFFFLLILLTFLILSFLPLFLSLFLPLLLWTPWHSLEMALSKIKNRGKGVVLFETQRSSQDGDWHYSPTAKQFQYILVFKCIQYLGGSRAIPWKIVWVLDLNLRMGTLWKWHRFKWCLFIVLWAETRPPKKDLFRTGERKAMQYAN